MIRGWRTGWSPFPPRRPAGRTVGRVAFNMYPARGPWGGSSTFVSQFQGFLERRGYEVTFSLSKTVDIIVLIDPRDDLQNKSIGLTEILHHKENNPGVFVLHRINECDQRKSTAFMDPLLAEANEVADYTVFISEWLKEYHSERWFDRRRPHAVIYNGADPAVFHPVGCRKPEPGRPLRLVTHHWSDNALKGFDVYLQLDRLIADGLLADVEFWVIGRWPAGIQWRAAHAFPPTSGHDLADKLRCCDAYITASRWEPCGMHHVEGAQCGLPLLYHEDGGGISEAGRRYGVGFREHLEAAVLEMRERYHHFRSRLFDAMPSGDRMCLEYADICQRLVSLRVQDTT